MTSRSVQIHELRIPLQAIECLSEEDRFAYYLLGHMFNELMCLQKLVAFALPKHDDIRPARRRPELAQALALFRLACSKIWEAKLALQTKEVSQTLRMVVLPKLENGIARLKALNAELNSAPWLGPLRNGMGFHFPDFKQWRADTTPQVGWVDDIVIFGESSGNTFYEASETIAQAWMFRECARFDGEIAPDPDRLIGQMINLLATMNSFLEDSLGVFIVSGWASHLDEEPTRHVVAVSSPAMSATAWLP
ncbi:UNVERIFIED_ORG: hypothetical protein J2W38_003676, partial [Variovorax paradoxus]|nr:hypothetical protein [Variovorax paradoxus]